MTGVNKLLQHLELLVSGHIAEAHFDRIAFISFSIFKNRSLKDSNFLCLVKEVVENIETLCNSDVDLLVLSNGDWLWSNSWRSYCRWL